MVKPSLKILAPQDFQNIYPFEKHFLNISEWFLKEFKSTENFKKHRSFSLQTIGFELFLAVLLSTSNVFQNRSGHPGLLC